MQVQIRQFRSGDLAEISRFFNHPEVVHNITQLPYASEEQWMQRLQNSAHEVTLVASFEENAIGCITLMAEKSMRRKHVATLAMAVDPAYHRRGIGTQLLTSATELADNWMNVARLELGVFTANRAAIQLYHRFGFGIEGEARGYAFGNGEYQDLLYMARVRKNTANADQKRREASAAPRDRLPEHEGAQKMAQQESSD